MFFFVVVVVILFRFFSMEKDHLFSTSFSCCYSIIIPQSLGTRAEEAVSREHYSIDNACNERIAGFCNCPVSAIWYMGLVPG